MGLLEERSGLTGKVAIVTGGGGGLGRAIALDLASSGVDVALCDRDEATLAETGKKITALGRRVLTRAFDVRHPEALDEFMAAFDETFDRLDVLVNVVGGTFRAAFMDTGAKGWDALIATNYLQVLACTRHGAERMRAGGRGGSIISLTSIEAHRAAPNYAVYGSLKAAITHLSRSLAVELGPHGIRVNTIAPGIVPTERLNEMMGASATDERLSALQDAMTIPLRRKGMLADMGNAALFLASDLSSYITGTTLHVDGGMLAAAGFLNWPGEGIRDLPPPRILEGLPPEPRG